MKRSIKEELTKKESEKKKQVKEEMVRWLCTFDWKLYCHLTTTPTENWKTISENTIYRYFCRLVRAIDWAIWGKRGRKKGGGVSFTIGIELTPGNKLMHIHGLIGGIASNMICRQCVKWYWELYCGKRTGMARVYDYDWEAQKQRGVFYLCKHQIKQQNIRMFIKEVKILPIRKEKIIHITKKGKKVCEIGNKRFIKSRQGSLFVPLANEGDVVAGYTPVMNRV